MRSMEHHIFILWIINIPQMLAYIYIYISLYTYIYISCMDPMGDMFFDLQSSESIFLHTLKTKGQE